MPAFSIYKAEDNLKLFQKAPPDESSCLSEGYVNFRNVAVTLKSNTIKISSITDLSQFPRQEDQVKMFLANRVDAIVLERNIFSYYLKKTAQFKRPTHL